MADDWSIEESQVVVGPEVQDIKLFGKWSADEVQVGDISLTVSIYLTHWVAALSPWRVKSFGVRQSRIIK